MSSYQTNIIKEYEKKGYYVINLIATNKGGIPDLLCLRHGYSPLFIECKQGKDTLKELQKYRIKELRNLGFDAFCSHDTKGKIF
jgi:Holliday junction resolvase